MEPNECTICGKKVDILNKVEMEGTVIEVCEKCTKFGTKIIPRQSYKPIAKKIEFKIEEDEFVPDYGKAIKRYRESKCLNREEFSKQLNEKETVIKRVEEEQMEPDERLTKKLENLIGTKLTQKYSSGAKTSEKKKHRLTVGDIVEVK